MAEKEDGKITSYLRRKREESSSGSSGVDKPPYKVAKEIELISELDNDENASLKQIRKIVNSVQNITANSF